MQATTNCQDAKDYLEMMCQDLTSELAQFDLLKEQELKQILLAYVTAQLEAQEKVRTKTLSFDQCIYSATNCTPCPRTQLLILTRAHTASLLPPSLPPSSSPSIPPPSRSLTSLLPLSPLPPTLSLPSSLSPLSLPLSHFPPPSLPSPSHSLTSLLQSKSKWFSLTVILDTPIKPEARAIQFKTAESEDTSQ